MEVSLPTHDINYYFAELNSQFRDFYAIYQKTFPLRHDVFDTTGTIIFLHRRLPVTSHPGAWPTFQPASTFVSTWRRQDAKLDAVWNFRRTDSEYQFPGNLHIQQSSPFGHSWESGVESGVFFLLYHHLCARAVSACCSPRCRLGRAGRWVSFLPGELERNVALAFSYTLTAAYSSSGLGDRPSLNHSSTPLFQGLGNFRVPHGTAWVQMFNHFCGIFR